MNQLLLISLQSPMELMCCKAKKTLYVSCFFFEFFALLCPSPLAHVLSPVATRVEAILTRRYDNVLTLMIAM